MEEISVKNKKYVKAKRIARELGYTNDYIGQLCRSGKVDAELVGRTWYVDPESVKSHKHTRYRSSKASTRRELQSEVLRAMREEQAAQQAHFYAKHQLRDHSVKVAYETDASELIPVPQKHGAKASIELPIELADAEKVSVEVQNEKKYHFEAPKREEIKFFGTLKVTDFLTEVAVAGDEDKPQKVTVTSRHKPHATSAHRADSQEKHLTVKSKEDTPHAVPFTDRPVHHEPHVETYHVVPVAVEDEEVSLPLRYHIFTASALVMGALIAALCVGLETTVTATSDQLIAAYSFAAENLSALIYLIK